MDNEEIPLEPRGGIYAPLPVVVSVVFFFFYPAASRAGEEQVADQLKSQAEDAENARLIKWLADPAFGRSSPAGAGQLGKVVVLPGEDWWLPENVEWSRYGSTLTYQQPSFQEKNWVCSGQAGFTKISRQAGCRQPTKAG